MTTSYPFSCSLFHLLVHFQILQLSLLHHITSLMAISILTYLLHIHTLPPPTASQRLSMRKQAHAQGTHAKLKNSSKKVHINARQNWLSLFEHSNIQNPPTQAEQSRIRVGLRNGGVGHFGGRNLPVDTGIYSFD